MAAPHPPRTKTGFCDPHLGLSLEKCGKNAEPPPEALAIERGMGLGKGKDELFPLVAQRDLVDDAGMPIESMWAVRTAAPITRARFLRPLEPSSSVARRGSSTATIAGPSCRK